MYTYIHSVPPICQISIELVPKYVSVFAKIDIGLLSVLTLMNI